MCEVRLAEDSIIEGVTEHVKRQIKSRKKAYPNETDRTVGMNIPAFISLC
jgi:hypothetical protein